MLWEASAFAADGEEGAIAAGGRRSSPFPCCQANEGSVSTGARKIKADISPCAIFFVSILVPPKVLKVSLPPGQSRGRALYNRAHSHLGPHKTEGTHHGHIFMLDVMAVEHIVTNVIFGPGRSGPRIRLRCKFEHDPH